MSLTDKQKECVTKSWGGVKPYSMDIFLYFFEKNPDLQQKFESYRCQTLDEIKVNIKHRSHALRVYHVLKSLIDNLDDMELVDEILRKIVFDHCPNGIVSGDYQKLLTAIVEFMEKTLGDTYCANTKEGWSKVADIIIGVIDSELAKICPVAE